jgi:purine-binding chemotaxis protein CheW
LSERVDMPPEPALEDLDPFDGLTPPEPEEMSAVEMSPEEALVPKEAEPEDEEPTVKHIVFGLNGARYAVSIRSVLELDRLSPITPVPNTPEFVLGVTNVRGDVVSVLDLRRLLGLPPLARPETGRLIQVRPTKNVVRSGVLVDSILGMRPVRTGRIEPDPTADAHLGLVLDGLYADNPEPLRVLNIEKLFQTDQIRALLGDGRR